MIHSSWETINQHIAEGTYFFGWWLLFCRCVCCQDYKLELNQSKHNTYIHAYIRKTKYLAKRWSSSTTVAQNKFRRITFHEVLNKPKYIQTCTFERQFRNNKKQRYVLLCQRLGGLKKCRTNKYHLVNVVSGQFL